MGAGIARAGAAMALCGAGLALITVVAQPGSPEDPRGWTLVAATGVPAGLLAGIAIAIVAVTRQRRFEART